MANDRIPFVAIIGGLWILKDPSLVAEAQNMASEIGAALAKAEMGLVVYFSDVNSRRERFSIDSSAVRRVTKEHGEVRRTNNA
jgi:hypothetical protein